MKPCACGKQAWPTRNEADKVVMEAKIRAGLRGNTRRREQRSYACPEQAGLWHVTSQPVTAVRRGSADHPKENR